MKDLFPIKVECHSGYKADEYPRRFYLDTIRFEVEEIIDRWYQVPSSQPDAGSGSGFPAANYFKVRTPDKKIYILKHEIQADQWFVWIKGESMNLH